MKTLTYATFGILCAILLVSAAVFAYETRFGIAGLDLLICNQPLTTEWNDAAPRTNRTN